MLFEPTLRLSGLLAKFTPTRRYTNTISKPTLNCKITNPTRDTDTFNQPQAHTTATPTTLLDTSSWTNPRLLLAPKNIWFRQE